MLPRRALQVLLGTAIIGLSATGLAAPAQADTTVTVTGNFTNFGTYFFSSSAYAGVDPESVQGSTVTVVADITWVIQSPPQLYVLNEALSKGGVTCSNTGCPLDVGGAGATFDVASWASNTSVLVTTFAGTDGAEKRVKIDNATYRGGALSDVFFLLTYQAPVPAITGVSPSTGPVAGGTSVTISGTDLDNASSVTFGGTAASSFTVDDSTQITAMTPAGTAGAVDVVVTTPGGDDTSVGAFTYTAPAPDPTPTPATPPSAPESGDVEPGSGAVTVSWEPPATQGSFPITNYQVQSTPGSAGCLVAATQRQCTVSGLTNGRSYSFQVRALNGGGWGPWADAGSATPVAPAEATILISGTRGDVRGKPGIIVTGTTTGLTEGSTLHPWIRLDGRRSSRMGEALITLDASGEFTWQRRVNRNIDVQIRSADGSVRSQELRITVR